MTNGNVTAKLVERLDQGPADSKKWKMTKIGLAGIASFTALGAFLFVERPETAPSAVLLIGASIAAWTAMASTYTVMQGRSDEKTTAAIADTSIANVTSGATP
jgi:hypothetical protein